jgi:hypothetical protein
MIGRRLALSAVLLAAACTGASTTAATAPSSSDPTLRTLAGTVFGTGDYPSYAVDVPPGWSTTDGHFVVKTGPVVIGLSVWDVGQVPRHPCNWSENLRDPGPTVDDLVGALATQRLREATEPIDVSLGGYEGRYLQLSVPADWVVTGDSDFKGCDDPGNGHQDFVSWLGDGQGERYAQVVGQIDRLWILDVDGQRLLVDATYSPDSTKAGRDELTSIAGTIRFGDASA